MTYYREIIEILKKKKLSKEALARLKIKLCKKYKVKKIPTDIQILLHAKPNEIKKLKHLQTKPTRSLSGVAVVAIMSKPYPCPHAKKGIGPCAMCPGGPESAFGEVPQSYTGKEPATMRAIRAGYDPYLQVFNRLEQYIVLGHVPDKIELILMGGTFPSFPKKYQEEFVKYAFKAMNDFSQLFFKNKFDFIKFKEFFELPGEVGDKKRTKSIHSKLKKLKGKTTLEKEQKRNEKSKIRCIGLTIETRPDYATLKHGNEMLRLGCTRVELGIQSVYDKVLEKIKRGHTIEQNIHSIKILKDLGFKLNFHYMIGLPLTTEKMDLRGLKELFSNANYQPDMLKLYPCMVLKGTKLYEDWKNKKYKPITTKKAAKLIAEFKKYIPIFCRVMRVQRDVPTYMIEAGVDKTNLRQYVQKLMKTKCKCIRCREIGRLGIKGNIKINTKEYNASKGKEFFISADASDALVGFCRLRFPSNQLRKEITKDSALVRELHVYGEAVALGKKGFAQHKGYGKKLLKKAEEIAKKDKKKKIVVISGIGAREYYKKLGYKKQGPYMVKKL